MTLQIKEHKNNMEIYDTPNNLDKALIDDDISPLPNYSGFSMLIVGPSGSGKTTALYSMMSKRKIQGKRVSYRKVFDKIYIISPTMANEARQQRDQEESQRKMQEAENRARLAAQLRRAHSLGHVIVQARLFGPERDY